MGWGLHIGGLKWASVGMFRPLKSANTEDQRIRTVWEQRGAEPLSDPDRHRTASQLSGRKLLQVTLGQWSPSGRPVACGCAEQGLLGHCAQNREGLGAPGKRAIPRHGQIWARCEGGLGFPCCPSEGPLWPELIMSRRGSQRVWDHLEVPVYVQGGAHAPASCCQSPSWSSVEPRGQGLCLGGIWSVKWGGELGDEDGAFEVVCAKKGSGCTSYGSSSKRRS